MRPSRSVAGWLPLAAGATLCAAPFAPWVRVGASTIPGSFDALVLWGCIAAGALSLAAALTFRPRPLVAKASILALGLAAVVLTATAWRELPIAANERVQARLDALAIVEPGAAQPSVPAARPSYGVYVALAAACVLVAVGSTVALDARR